MTPRPATRQRRTSPARARSLIQSASILVLLVAVASLQWPAPPVASQGGSDPPAAPQTAAPSESSAPSADTDKWQLVRVSWSEYTCRGENPRGERGLDPNYHIACDRQNFYIWDSFALEGTMTMTIPKILEPGKKTEFTLDAEGKVSWETSERRNRDRIQSHGELHALLSGGKGNGICKREETVSTPSAVTGTGKPELKEPLKCEFDPAVDFGDGDEAYVSYDLKIIVKETLDQGAGAMSTRGTVGLTYKRCVNPEDCPPPPRRPVLILHGIGGSFATGLVRIYPDWLLKRGAPPHWMQIDPIKRTYDDLIKTLENVGYEKGKDLFVVAYDWRLTPGPVDGTFDGHLEGLTGESITDDKYEYGVDYLGYWLKEAAEAWHREHPEAFPLDAVDVVAHSMGGLVARSYIQSDAYGDTFSSQGETMRLPKINNLIMVAVPNRGASLPWQAMHNDFSYDATLKHVFAKTLNHAYQKVKEGKTIRGPDDDSTKDDITKYTIMEGGKIKPELFINQYAPSLRSLLATYPFYYTENAPDSSPTTVNVDPDVNNRLLLDLNNGFDHPWLDVKPEESSPFASKVNHTWVFYAELQLTPGWVREAKGYGTSIVKWFPLGATFEQPVPKGMRYYKDIELVLGDDTVPSLSVQGQFVSLERFTKRPIGTGSTTHTGLMSNKAVQKGILGVLEVEFEEKDISTGSVPWGTTSLINAWSILSDPVEAFLVDGSGRRLGYSQSTGAVTEIPNSVWFGGADGIGWVFDAVQEPLSVEMTGLGEDYYVQVSGEQVGMTGGMEASGTLAKGQNKTVTVETEQRGTRTYLPLIQRNYKLPPAPSTGWQTLLHEGFEAPLSGPWEFVGRGWGRTDCRAFAGTHSLSAAGDTGGAAGPCPDGYPNSLNTWLIYGPFDLAGAKAAEISFQRWQKTQKDHDEFSWMVSVDNDHYWGLTSSGGTGGWKQVVLDLGNVYGLGDLRGERKVWLALIFQSDGAVSEGGVFVDDLRIRKKVSTSASSDSPGRPETSSLQGEPAGLRRPGSGP